MTPTEHLGRFASLVSLVVLVAACGGAAPTAMPTPTAAAIVAPNSAAPATVPPVTAPPITAPPVTAPPVTEPPVTTAPITPAPPTSAPTAPVSSGRARVDLEFKKTRVFFANGTAGTCLITKVNGVTRFAFEASAADYGAFGERFAVTEVDGKIEIDWVISSTIHYANNPNVVIKISTNHRKVTLDQNLLPLTSPGDFTPGPQHIKGTITCA